MTYTATVINNHYELGMSLVLAYVPYGPTPLLTYFPTPLPALQALDDRTATILKKLQTHLERTKSEFKNSMRQAMMAVANWYWRAGTPRKHSSKALSIQTGKPDNTFSYASIFLGFTLAG